MEIIKLEYIAIKFHKQTLIAQNYRSLFIYSLMLFIPFSSLINILLNILLLQLPHALDFIQIDHEALIIRVELLDAFAAEHCQVVATIKVLNPLLMIVA